MADLKSSLNRADLNALADEFRSLALGDMVAAFPTTLRTCSAAANVGSVGYVFAKQSADIPAASILWAYAKAGSGTPAQLTVVAYGTTPTAGQIGIASNGKIVTASADAWTNVDVCYVPEKGDQFSVTLPVASNTLTLPSNMITPGASTLLSVVVNTGSVVGAKIVEVAGATPTTGEACLNAAKTQVVFASADAVTNATVTVLCSAAIDVSAALAAPSTFI